MPTTYSPATSFTNPIHWVRLTLADTGVGGEFLLDDDEIAGAIGASGVRVGMGYLLDALTSRLVVMQATMTVSGPFTRMYTDRLKALELLKKRLPTMLIPPGIDAGAIGLSGPTVGPLNDPDFGNAPLMPTGPDGRVGA